MFLARFFWCGPLIEKLTLEVVQLTGVSQLSYELAPDNAKEISLLLIWSIEARLTRRYPLICTFLLGIIQKGISIVKKTVEGGSRLPRNHRI